MYLGFVLIALGVAIAFNSWWLVAASILLWLAIHIFVIKPEERYLLSRFGAEYEKYLTRTRRWL
jgi:protein-S-isoprenylcysteine O-methyltransferase Ste14